MTNMSNTTDVTSGTRTAYHSWAPEFCLRCSICCLLHSVLWTIACFFVLFSLAIVSSSINGLGLPLWIMFTSICTILSLYIKSKLWHLLEVSLYFRGEVVIAIILYIFVRVCMRMCFFSMIWCKRGFRVDDKSRIVVYYCLLCYACGEMFPTITAAYQIPTKINILLNFVVKFLMTFNSLLCSIQCHLKISLKKSAIYL